MKIAKEDLKALRATASLLLPRHLSWCVDAALQGMMKNVVSAEEEIARHTALAGTPNYAETARQGADLIYERTSRWERINKLREDLVQYAKIIQFLRVLRDAVIRFNAEHTTIEFGKD